MKKSSYLLASIAAIVIGVLLLIFNHQAYEVNESVLKGVVLATGIIFTVPGFVLLIASFKPKRDADGNIEPKPWYVTAVAIATLTWGIFMICMPAGFLGNLNVTLGVSLVIAGLAQMMWFAVNKIVFRSGALIYALPVIAVGAGIIVCTLPNDYSAAGQSGAVGCIVSGIVAVLWGLNTFFALKK